MVSNVSLLILINLFLISNQNITGKGKGGYLSWRKPKQDSYKLVCYMTNWAQYRPNNTKYVPSNLDPFLCTHYIYAFAAINTSTYEIKSFEWNDESKEEFVGRYQEFNNLKRVNPGLKTLLAVGGWNMGTGPFSDMTKNETTRQIFIRSAVRFLRKWKFDGLDLDWEFPAKRDGSRTDDNKSFSYLVKELREAFYVEALAVRKEQLLLSAAVAAEKFTILKAYEVENIVSHLDFISIMSYDYHGAWDKKLGHNSPLYSSDKDSEEDQKLSVDWTVRLYYTLGVPAEKLVLGIPFYGRSFTLKNKNERSFGSESVGDGQPGDATRESGFLSYGFEICKYIKQQNWTRGWSREHQVPYAYKNTQWVGYDDEESVKTKVNYATKYCLGGAMVWSIDLDDFKGFCSDKPYPLTRAILQHLKSMDRKKCLPLNKVKDKDVDEYLAKVRKWLPSSNEIKEDSSETKTSFTNKITDSTTRTYPIDLTTSIFKTLTSNKKQASSELELRSEKLNDIMLRVYQNSNYQTNEIDRVLKQFLLNTSKLDETSSSELNYNLFDKNYRPSSSSLITSTKIDNYSLIKKDNFGCEELEDGELVRDPNDCSSFYTCFMRKASKKTTCDQGLVFDNRLKVCNWKHMVQC